MGEIIAAIYLSVPLILKAILEVVYFKDASDAKKTLKILGVCLGALSFSFAFSLLFKHCG